MSKHRASLKLSKTGEAVIECNGCSDHLPHKVDVTSAVYAVVRLKGSCLPPPTGNIWDAFIFAVIADFWKNKSDENGIEKNELRKKFPGIGGDTLNESLSRLLAHKAISLGSCGCCYGLPKSEDLQKQNRRRPNEKSSA
jgi:hypothetical protein